LPKIVKYRQVLGHHKNAARLLAHIDQELHLLGRRASQKSEEQRGQIGLIGRGALRPKLVYEYGAAGRSLTRFESPSLPVNDHLLKLVPSLKIHG